MDSRIATAESEYLVEEALTLLKMGDAERAFWRLVDAAGLIHRKCFINPLTTGTINNPTGRGFYIGEKTDAKQNTNTNQESKMSSM